MEFLLPKNTVHSLVKIVPVVLENMKKIEEVYDDYDKDDNKRQLLAKLHDPFAELKAMAMDLRAHLSINFLVWFFVYKMKKMSLEGWGGGVVIEQAISGWLNWSF